MKKLIIITNNRGGSGEIYIENADELQDKIFINNGIITFGKEVGVNLNSLVSFQFEDVKENTI